MGRRSVPDRYTLTLPAAAVVLATLLFASLFAGAVGANAALSAGDRSGSISGTSGSGGLSPADGPGSSATNTPRPTKTPRPSDLPPTSTPIPPTAVPPSPTPTGVPPAAATPVPGAPTATGTPTPTLQAVPGAATATPTPTVGAPTATPTPTAGAATATPTLDPLALTPSPTATVDPFALTPFPPLPTDTPIPVGSPPPNDDLGSATLITSLPFTDTVDTTGATVAADDPDMGTGAGLGQNTVWYRLVAPFSGRVHSHTFGSDHDTMLAAFTGTRGALKLIVANDDTSSPVATTSATQSEITFDVQQGVQYYLEVASFDVGGGTARLTIETAEGAAATATATATVSPAATFLPTPTSLLPATTPQALVALPAAPAAPAPARAVPADDRYFGQTGYRVGRDAFWDYFQKRGGVTTFGYPVSREFTLFGHPVQFFQRAILQATPEGSVASMNLLDEGLMPYTKINFSSFPEADRELIDAAPSAADPDYAEKAIAFLQANVPDEQEGQPVNFLETFLSTVRYEDAFPNGEGDPALIPLLNLEVWGLPTSRPAYDPHNQDFVYQRFQRGILHYDASTGTTQGLLLADYLKSIMTGQGLPPDLDLEARGTAFYRQYDRARPGHLTSPERLPGSDLTDAFESSR